MNKDIRELIIAYGWIPIDCKNPYMESFVRDESDDRLDFYFTTGTITIQGDGNQKVFKKVGMSEEATEELLIKLNNV